MLSCKRRKQGRVSQRALAFKAAAHRAAAAGKRELDEDRPKQSPAGTLQLLIRAGKAGLTLRLPADTLTEPAAEATIATYLWQPLPAF